MKQIRYICKSPTPPWNDSAKNIVRDLLNGVNDYKIEYLSDGEYIFQNHHVASPVYRENTTYSLSIKEQVKLFLYLSKPDFHNDLYHFFFTPTLKSALPLKALKMVKRRPFVQTLLSLPNMAYFPEQLFFGDKIITMSDHSRNLIQGLGDFDVSTIYPGVSVNQPTPDEVAAAKSTFLIPKGKIVILYAGDYQEGIYDILEIARTLYSSKTRLMFRFAVRIKSENDFQHDYAFRRAVGRLNLPDSYIKIYNELKDFHCLMRASDMMIFYQKSLFAKMDIPLVVLEAMGYGKPVIVSGNPMLRELNRDDNLLIANDRQGLIEQIKLLKQQKQRIKFGKRNRRVVTEFFTLSQMVHNYEKIYQTLLSE